MKTSHTPGPWTQQRSQGSVFAFTDSTGFPVLRINGGMLPVTADARLIAAAPDLLAALEDVDLRCTQARLASRIGKKKDRSDFLRGELERIAAVACVAIAKARSE